MIRGRHDAILGQIGGGSTPASPGNPGDSVDAQGAPDMKLPHNLVSQQPRRAVNFQYRMIFAATGVPQQFPALVVPMGLSVTLRASNSTLAGNAGMVRVAATQDGLDGGAGRAISPDTVISFPVDHMAQIWAVGTAGDGIIADVSGVPIG